MPRKTLIPLPDFGLIAHFHDTIETIGGWKGILLICVLALAFQSFVTWFISRGSAKRREARQVQKKTDINKAD